MCWHRKDCSALRYHRVMKFYSLRLSMRVYWITSPIKKSLLSSRFLLTKKRSRKGIVTTWNRWLIRCPQIYSSLSLNLRKYKRTYIKHTISMDSTLTKKTTLSNKNFQWWKFLSNGPKVNHSKNSYNQQTSKRDQS